jgi:hypothetical protein
MSKDIDTILTSPKAVEKMAALTKKLSEECGDVSISFDSPADHIEIRPDGKVVKTPRQVMPHER